MGFSTVSTLMVILVLGKLSETQKINCKNKYFICINSTSFQNCVPSENGTTFTNDDIQKCPDDTICDIKHPVPCWIFQPTIIPTQTHTTSTTIAIITKNCNGRNFICTDTTNFYNCKALDNGTTVTDDDEPNACPPGTICEMHNSVPCTVPVLTTLSTPSKITPENKPTKTTTKTNQRETTKIIQHITIVPNTTGKIFQPTTLRLPHEEPTIDCKGNKFICINTSHFVNCKMENGTTVTADNKHHECPPETECNLHNLVPCEILVPNTLSTPPKIKPTTTTRKSTQKATTKTIQRTSRILPSTTAKVLQPTTLRLPQKEPILNCNGKHFICTDTTHFINCKSLENETVMIEEMPHACPPGTVCGMENIAPCTIFVPTTLSTPIKIKPTKTTRKSSQKATTMTIQRTSRTSLKTTLKVFQPTTSTLPHKAPSKNCNGKYFLCIDTTHFMNCTFLENGTSLTADEMPHACPPSTICDMQNMAPCTIFLQTTLSTLPKIKPTKTTRKTTQKATTMIIHQTSKISPKTTVKVFQPTTSSLPHQAPSKNCNGKSFLCMDTTYFINCKSLDNGTTVTVDEMFRACPPETVCDMHNIVPCTLLVPTTLSTPPKIKPTKTTRKTTRKATTMIIHHTSKISPKTTVKVFQPTTLSLPHKAPSKNCNGKYFLCIDTTHFMNCTFLENGTSLTVDEMPHACPSGTICDMQNIAPCTIFVPTILSTSPKIKPTTTTRKSTQKATTKTIQRTSRILPSTTGKVLQPTTLRLPQKEPILNCNGKHFICTDTTHFINCKSLENGTSLTVDEMPHACPPGTICDMQNIVPCTIFVPTTLSTPPKIKPTKTTRKTTQKATTMIIQRTSRRSPKTTVKVFQPTSTLPHKAPNKNCNGKSFLCIDTARFMNCTFLENGTSLTVDEMPHACPPGTICDMQNIVPCTIFVPTTLSTPPKIKPTKTTRKTTQKTTTMIIHHTSKISPKTTVKVFQLTTLSLPHIAPSKNCNGKYFICTNNTHFINCKSLQNGTTVTANDKIHECPSDTECGIHNLVPCIVLLPTTLSTPTKITSKNIPISKTTQKTTKTIQNTSRIIPKTTVKVPQPTTLRLPIESPNKNCRGKYFVCIDTTHFINCKSLENGTTVMLDEMPHACPPNTECDVHNLVPCAVVVTSTEKIPKNITSTIKTTQKIQNYPIIYRSGCPGTALFGDYDDCRVFYMCIGYTKLRFLCPVNTVFSQKLGFCSYDSSQCKYNGFRCKTSGNTADPDDRYRFYECIPTATRLIPRRWSCPAGTQFDEYNKRCI